MITYKYKIQNTVDISKYLKPYNNVVRYAYNRYQENPNLSIDEIVRLAQSNMKHTEVMDFTLIRYAVLKASSMKEKSGVIFGGRRLFNALKFFAYKKDPKIPLSELKKQYQEKRYNRPLFLRGCCEDSHGNRKAELDIIDNNSIIVKFNKNEHVEIKLPNLSEKHKEHLYRLQDLCDTHKGCFSLEVNNEYVYIIFEEKLVKSEKTHKFIENRILAIDLNPNYIGLSVCAWSVTETKKIVYDLVSGKAHGFSRGMKAN